MNSMFWAEGGGTDGLPQDELVRKGGRVDVLNFLQVGFCAHGLRIGWIPTVIAFYSFVLPIALHIVPEDTDSKIDVVFDFEEVDTFLFYRASPRWNVYLHNPHGVAWGNRKWVASTLDDHDAGGQAWINVVFSAAAHQRFRKPFATGRINFKLFQETVDGLDGGIGTRNRRGHVRVTERGAGRCGRHSEKTNHV